MGALRVTVEVQAQGPESGCIALSSDARVVVDGLPFSFNGMRIDDSCPPLEAVIDLKGRPLDLTGSTPIVVSDASLVMAAEVEDLDVARGVSGPSLIRSCSDV